MTSRVRSLMRANKGKQLPGTKIKFRSGKKGIGIKSIKYPKHTPGARINLRGME